MGTIADDATQVSVPWRGLGSFGLGLLFGAVLDAFGFRPLAGIRVFRTTPGQTDTS